MKANNQIRAQRQRWLLLLLLSRPFHNICETSRVPYGFSLNGGWFPCPGGIGMTNVRGLERRGLVKTVGHGIWELTKLGLEQAQREAEQKARKG